MSWMTLSSTSLLRNPQYPKSPSLLDPNFLTHFQLRYHHEISGYLPWGKRKSFMTLWMTLSSTSLLRNPQCPPGTPFLTPPSFTHFPLRYHHEIFRDLPLNKRTSFMMSWIPLSSTSPLRNPQHPPIPPPSWTNLLDKVVKGTFLRVRKHHSWCHGWPFYPCLCSGTWRDGRGEEGLEVGRGKKGSSLYKFTRSCTIVIFCSKCCISR